MIEIKMMKYQFGRTSEEAVQAMLVERWQIQSDNIITEEGRTFYAVVWRRMTPELATMPNADSKPYTFEDELLMRAASDQREILVEGMTLELADGETVTVSGITMKNGEIHRVKVTKPNPREDSDTNVTTTMKLETLIAKLPETHPWHDTPPHVQA